MFQKLVAALKKTTESEDHASETDVLYPCGDLQIILPQKHKLPLYQRHHQNYNKFLPHLAHFVPGYATIIDVGANCGYILAGMAQNNACSQYICIEPDGSFNRYLTMNLDIIRSVYPDFRAVVLDELVGKNIKNAALNNSGGTSVAVPGDGHLVARSLDEIMNGFINQHVGLLKSDVDGFDYDVLDSAKQLIEHQHPALFFECQHDHDYQKAGFSATISWLIDCGYRRWAVFGNFGSLMLVTEEGSAIYALMDYVMRQNKKTATRTVYYYDLFAVCEDKFPLMDSALQSY